MSEDASEAWKLCSSCKSPIDFEQKYWVCNISTCNRSRMSLYFCKVACWDAHLPTARHRSGAWAVEKRAPSRSEHEREQATLESRGSAGSASGSEASAPQGSGEVDTSEVLVVATRVQAYVDERSQLRVSRSALHALSHLVRGECELAIENARQAGRKTVMDRDFVRPPPGTKQGETMLVVSRLKSYVKARAGMNTAGSVADLLSGHVRGWLHDAVRRARQAGRETVMDRDFE